MRSGRSWPSCRAGIEPDEVITDDSRLYPGVLAEIWPVAAHQLCLFHATRNVVKAVNEVVKQVRKSIPVPSPSTSPSLKGRHRDVAPTSDQHDPPLNVSADGKLHGRQGLPRRML